MKKLVVLLALLSFISCQEEKVIPAHPTLDKTQSSKNTQTSKETTTNTNSRGFETNANQANIISANGSYTIREFEINKPLDGKQPIVTDVANHIAGFFLAVDGDFDIDIDPITMDLAEYELEVIKKAIIKSINIEITDKDKKTDAKLNFIKELKIELVNTAFPEKRVMLIDLNDRTINNKHCKEKCIELDLSHINLVDYISDTQEITIIPTISVKKSPKKDFSIDVKVDFEVGVEMPF